MKARLTLFLVVIYAFVNFAFSQEVEKSIYGIQTGILGGWLSHEWRFSHHWVLHSELGLDGSLIGIVHEGDFPVFVPTVSVEPRWYYNLPKRKVESGDTFHNAGNFTALSFEWYPNWFSLSNQENVKVKDGFFIIPTWGIRRNINWHFYYELGAGVGFSINGLDEFEGDDTRLIYSLIARIGYKIF